MLALIDREDLGNAVCEGWIGIVQTRGELFKRNPIGPVSVNFVGRHVDERRFGTGSPCRFQQMQRPERIHLKIEKRNGGCTVMRRLCGGMDNQIRAYFIEQGQYALTIANVQRGMPVIGDFLVQALDHPTGVALRPEENRAMVVIDTVNLELLASEELRNLRANKSTRTGDDNLRHIS